MFLIALPLALLASLASCQSSTSSALSSTSSHVSGFSGTATVTLIGSSTLSALPSGSHSGSANASATISASVTSTAVYPDLGDYSVCVNQCLQVAVGDASCTSISDVNCYCHSGNRTLFANSIYACAVANCASDVQSAEQLAQRFCTLASTSVTLSFPGSSAVPTSVSSGVSSSSVSRSSVPSSGASASASAPSASGSTSAARASRDGGASTKLLAALVLAAGVGMAM